MRRIRGPAPVPGVWRTQHSVPAKPGSPDASTLRSRSPASGRLGILREALEVPVGVAWLGF